MIYEVITSSYNNKCGNCRYFKTYNHIDGVCINTENNIKYRQRFYNSKSCTFKELRNG